MNLDVRCNKADSSAHGGSIYLELYDVDTDLLDQFTMSDIINHFGELSVLKEIDSDVVKEYAKGLDE